MTKALRAASDLPLQACCMRQHAATLSVWREASMEERIKEGEREGGKEVGKEQRTQRSQGPGAEEGEKGEKQGGEKESKGRR